MNLNTTMSEKKNLPSIILQQISLIQWKIIDGISKWEKETVKWQFKSHASKVKTKKQNNF